MNLPTESAINFSALANRHNDRKSITLVRFFAFLCAGCLLFALFVSGGNAEMAITGWFVLIYVTAPIGFLLWYIHRFANTSQIDRNQLQQFATDNKFTFIGQHRTGYSGPSQALRTLDSNDSSMVIQDNIAGQRFGLQFKLSEYTSSQITHLEPVTVMEYILPHALPQLYIDSKQSTISPRVYRQSAQLELEGDFQKYYNVYSPDGHAIDTLSILGPDTMQALISLTSPCDIEIVQNRLYFCWSQTVASQIFYKQVFTTSDVVMQEVGSKLGILPHSAANTMPNNMAPTIKNMTLAYYIAEYRGQIIIWGSLLITAGGLVVLLTLL